MSVPVPDPETIAMLQSFGYGIAQNLIASAIVEWKKLKDDRHAQANTAWLENVEHSKKLEARIGQNISRAFRSLNLSRKDVEFLLPLAKDAILHAELSRQIVADLYTTDSVASLLVGYQHPAALDEARIKSFAKLLIEAIQNAIAEDPHLCRVKQLRFQARMCETHQVEFRWVRGHAGNLENERCDQLSMAALHQPNLPADEGYENKPESEGVRPVMQEGEPCRKCSTPVIKRKGKWKQNQDHYFEYHLWCPKCEIAYHVESAKRFVEQTQSLL